MSDELERRKHTARKVELAAETTAGTVGSAFGAAKLRDSFKQDYPKKYYGALRAGSRTARRAGASPQTVARAVRAVHTANPAGHFAPLATVATAGAAAATARRYQGLESLRQRRRQAARDGQKVETVDTIDKGFARNARSAVSHGEAAAKNAEEITGKVKGLIPTRRTAVLAAAGATTAGSGALFGGSYLGTKAGTRSGVSKSVSAFGVDHGEPIRKDYAPGTITYHQQQADLHARKKTSARRRMETGLFAATTGATVAGAAAVKADKIAQAVTPKSSTKGPHALRVARNTVSIERGATRAAVGAAVGGGALAAEGAVSRAYHAHRQNKATRDAQAARRQRNTALAKAFDAERARHARGDTLAGAAAGGAVLAGGGAVRNGRNARSAGKTARRLDERAGQHFTASERLMRMANPSARQTARAQAGLGLKARDDSASALKASTKLARRAKGQAGLAAALGAGAVGLAHHSHYGSGRAYSYS